MIARRTIALRVFAAGAAAALLFCAGAQAQPAQPAAPPGREIAFTFDDAPTPDSQTMKGVERTRRLIAALKRAHVEGAAIFAVGERARGEGRARLAAYARAGHFIANHSNTHRSANALPTAEFLEDVRRADAALRRLPRFRRWFRFPFLDAGDTVEKRDALRAGLRRMRYAHGIITIDPWDWCMNGIVGDAVARGDTIDWPAVRDVYVDVIARSAAFYDALARRRLGRAPRHVLLLHENDLAALYIEDVARRLRAEGWRIVPADAAFADPIAAIDPDTLYLNGGQLVALAHIAGAPEAETSSGFKSERRLAALLARAITPRSR